MTQNMYDAADALAKGSGSGGDAEARRLASIGKTWSDAGEQFLADVARAKAEGLKISPRMTMAVGYAEAAKAAAAKTDTNTTNQK